MLEKLKGAAATGAKMLYNLNPFQKPETRAGVLHNDGAATKWNAQMRERVEGMTQRPILDGISNVRKGIFNVLHGLGLAVGGAINTGIDVATVPLDIGTHAAYYAANVKQLLDRGNLIVTDLITRNIARVSSVTDGVRNKLKGAVGWLFGMDDSDVAPDLKLVKDTAAATKEVLATEEPAAETKVAAKMAA